jgi:large subunit ribosomal protein L9
MQVILLEAVNKLGKIGDVVKIADGYGRNYLIPRKKAIRATKDNIAYFEQQRATYEQENLAKKNAAEATAQKLQGASITLIRQSAEDGRLYGSVTSRDIANAIKISTGIPVTYDQVILNTRFKEIGTYDINISLHAEVKVKIALNIARSEISSHEPPVNLDESAESAIK